MNFEGTVDEFQKQLTLKYAIFVLPLVQSNVGEKKVYAAVGVNCGL